MTTAIFYAVTNDIQPPITDELPKSPKARAPEKSPTKPVVQSQSQSQSKSLSTVATAADHIHWPDDDPSMTLDKFCELRRYHPSTTNILFPNTRAATTTDRIRYDLDPAIPRLPTLYPTANQWQNHFESVLQYAYEAGGAHTGVAKIILLDKPALLEPEDIELDELDARGFDITRGDDFYRIKRHLFQPRFTIRNAIVQHQHHPRPSFHSTNCLRNGMILSIPKVLPTPLIFPTMN